MWQVVGHETAVALLQYSIASERVAHAYLLTGPPQIGKTTLATNLAQALNCRSESRPCGDCSSCQRIARYVHPDVRLIEPEGDSIKIEQVRAMQREVTLSPYEGRWRVYILCQFEKATREAANCLLKTLEEPPEHVVLVLTAPEPDLLLPTIVSRCQILPLRPLPVPQVIQALRERWAADEEQASLLGKLSAGRIGWAVMAHRDREVLIRRERRLAALQDTMAGGRLERLRYAQQLSRRSESIPEILDLWLSWWRDLLLLRTGRSESVVNVDQISVLQQQARCYPTGQIKDFIQAIRAAQQQMQQNVNAQLALEVLFLSMPVIGSAPHGGEPGSLSE